MQRFRRGSIDLVVTSPPYARQRRRHYASVSEDDYPEWTLRWAESAGRILKPHGSICIVIRAHIRGGYVSPYVLRTRLALHGAGWREPQELIWHKPDAIPTGRSDRMRQSFEQVLWFSRDPHVAYCVPKANGRPSSKLGGLAGGSPDDGRNHLQSVGRGLIGGRKFLSAYPASKDRPRHPSKSVRLGLLEQLPPKSVRLGLIRTKDVKAISADIARSADVLTARVGSCNKAEWNTHPAQHPSDLYRQIIRILCPSDGTVLDPFAGSGTTLEAAYREGRSSISIDRESEYVDIIRRRFLDLTARAS